MKKTCLFTPCYLDGLDLLGNPRLERNIKYINYYNDIKKIIQFDSIILADNASNGNNLQKLFDGVEDKSTLKVLRFPDHLERGPGYDYPYCWRALYLMRDLITKMGYEKIITIDSDGFILSRRLAEFVRDCNTGWQSFWCKKYHFPEAAFHILNEDQFHLFFKYTSGDYMLRNGTIMEKSLPFTHVNKDFNCDRYGEDRVTQTHKMDWYGQCPIDIKPIFGMGKAPR